MIDLLKEKLKSLGLMLWNKGVAFVVLALVITRYLTLDEVTPFAEVIYALVLVCTVIVAGPIVRLLVFPNAAGYAEKGFLKKDLFGSTEPGNVHASRFSPALVHYWITTVLCYLITLLCVSSLL